MTLPTGTLTFLFTDVEGSTQLLNALGEDYGRLLEEHHRLMRQAVTAHGGTEVSTEGDSFFVVFPSAPAAVKAAVEAQRTFGRHAWGAGREVRVRMGLHTGEAPQMGDNYGGIDVHRAARIASAGHGGQILLSASTMALARSSLDDGLRVLDLSTHRLKDLDDTEHLFQLCVDDLPSKFPPLRTVGARPNNLPDRIGAFVHRDREVAEVKELVELHRLVTLTGPGGTGKTRLALKVGTDLLERFDDGVFFVQLAPLSDADLVAHTVAQTLGVRDTGLIPIEEALKVALSAKEMLLILDNFEQVIAASPLAARLLEAAQSVRIVVTSRSALGLYDEQEYPVPPMEVPDPAAVTFEQAAASESITLFVQRARQVEPSFDLTPDNAPVLTQICARLDGLPLAIELAAARTRLLSPSELSDRLDKSLSLLTGGAVDLPGRQRTLRGAIEWSYDLLEAPARSFFEGLGVFSGGWSLDAAEAVVGDDLGSDTLLELEALVNHSLVRRFENDRAETRFRMLQTIREFALEVLMDRPDAGALGDRHSRYFRDLAEAKEDAITKDERVGDLLAEEHGNLRSALRRSLEKELADDGLRTAAAVWRFWQVRGHLGEGRRWLAELLALPEGDPAVRAKALIAMGSLVYWQLDYHECARFYREGLALYRSLNDRVGEAQALYNLAFVDLLEGGLARAEERFDESLALQEELGDEVGVANILWGKAMINLFAYAKEGVDALGEATRLSEEALPLFVKHQDWFGQSLVEYVRLQVAKLSRDYDEVAAILAAQIEGALRSEDVTTMTSVCEIASEVAALRGDLPKALRLVGAAQAMKDRAGGQAPPPLLLKEFDDLPGYAAATLSSEEIEKYLAEGHAMSPEEALAYASKQDRQP